MIERNEFRVRPTMLEWRSARWSMQGWQPLSNTYAATELDGAGVEGAFKAWHASSHGRPRKRCFAVIDDAWVRYAMVPSFDEARSIREYQDGARLRCDTLLGWSPDKWTVQVALPPRSGPVLCCAYRTSDAQDWRAGCRSTGDLDPIIVPGAIAAVNYHRAHLIEDGWVVVASTSGCVAILLREQLPAAVYQTSIAPGPRWRDEDLQHWLESLSALMEPVIEARVRYLLDVRAWESGSRLRQSLDHFA